MQAATDRQLQAHKKWLHEARERFEYELHRIAAHTSHHRYLCLTQQSIMLIAIDRSLLNHLQRVLTPQSIQAVELVGPPRAVSNICCLTPPTDKDILSCLGDIQMMLASVESLTCLKSWVVPLPAVTALIPAYSHIQTLDLDLHYLGKSKLQLRAAAIKVQSLSDLHNLRLQNCCRSGFRAICPLLPALTNLSSIRLDGADLHMSTASDAAIIRGILSMTSLNELTLSGHVTLAIKEVAEAFCSGMKISRIQRLRILCTIDLHESCQADLGRSFANSDLMELQYSLQASNTFPAAFRDALAASVTSVLEKLTLYGMNHQGGSFIFNGVHEQHRGATYPDNDWVWTVKRCLEMNIQRRTSQPLLDAIDNAKDISLCRLRLVDALLVIDCFMAFEYVRNNRCNLIALIQQLGRESE